MEYARETNCSPFAPFKLRYRTEESSPRSLEPFDPTTHPSSHGKYDGSSNFEHRQVMRTTPELAPPFLTSTPHQQENV
ncbi:hypothetical protein TNCV_1307101 [Trichonephila clavipes]|nr:hypothetical protein TNCV_1307101 [Trichonephila clavipes]